MARGNSFWRIDLLPVFWLDDVLCRNLRILSLQTTHLKGKHLCETAFCIVLMKHFRQTTLWPQGNVRIVALAAIQITHYKKRKRKQYSLYIEQSKQIQNVKMINCCLSHVINIYAMFITRKSLQKLHCVGTKVNVDGSIHGCVGCSK